MAGSSRGAAVLDDLPDWIIVEEILTRLPTKDVLRCRAVRTSWRSGTSTKQFILAHRRRQPSLPIICVNRTDYAHFGVFCGTGAHPRRVLRYSTNLGYRYCMLELEAACDGLLLVSTMDDPDRLPKRVYHVCNPATRECAPVPQLPSGNSTHIAGFYHHQPSGEYRVLYWILTCNDGVNGDVTDVKTDFYVLTLGSGEHRSIEQPRLPPLCPPLESLKVLPVSCINAPILHRGCLHWQLGRDSAVICNILAFDPTAETFRLMHCPAKKGSWAWLLEMDGALASCCTSDGVHIDVSLMQDYVAEVWAFKCRINLSAMEAPKSRDELFDLPRMVMLSKREFLIQFPKRLLHCEIDGKLLGNMEGDMWVTRHFLQESMIQVPFSMIQQQDGVNMEPPYILGL